MTSRISIIAAIGKNRELGKNNKLLWHIPEDMKRFRQLTSGHSIIMGRKTFESIGRLLPNRTNIVVTRDPLFRVEGAVVVNSLEEAIEKASLYCHSELGSESKKMPKPLGLAQGGQVRHDTVEECEIFIIGGGQIYEQALPLADKLYLTIVDGIFDADTFFPEYSQFSKKIWEKKGESGGYRYRFLELERE